MKGISTGRQGTATSDSALRAILIASASITAICAPTVALAQTPAAASAGGEASAATTGLEEIVVTAQRREQRLQDVPVAVTALSPDALAANRVTSTRDLSGIVPNLTTTSGVGGGSTPTYSMRGEFAGTVALGADRGIAYYIDDVYIAATNGSLSDFADVSRIEVLRGPQGTLFGRNSTGGAISVHSPEPSDDFGVKEVLTYGNYRQFRSVTRLNTGKIGDFSASVSYVHSQRRGDIRNLRPGVVWDFSQAFGRSKTFTSPRYLGSNNSEGVQAAIKYNPSSDLKVIYRFDYHDDNFTQDGTGLVYANPLGRGLLATQDPATVTPIQSERPKTVNNGNAVPSHIDGYGHNMIIEHRLSDALAIKNILAYRKSTYNANWTDISGAGIITNTGAPIFTSALGAALAGSTVGQPFLIQATATSGTDKQISEEFQLNYQSSFVTATVGALYFRNRQTRGGTGEEVALGKAKSGAFRVYPNFAVPFAGQLGGVMSRDSIVITNSYAAFGQGEFHLTPDLDVIAGIRYTKDKKTGTDRAVFSAAAPTGTFALDFRKSKVTYNAGVNYKPTRDVLVYAKYGTGYISGGSIGGLAYQPQTAKSLEGGLKADWFDRMLRTNIAIFHVKYNNVQFSGNGRLLTPPRPELTNFLVSAGAAKAKGFELETQFVPARGLTFSAGLGYNDYKFTRLDPIVTTGNAFYQAISRPKWTATLSGQYETEPLFGDVRMTLRADGNYRSKINLVATIPTVTATFPKAEQDAFRAVSASPGYWLVNTRASLDGFKIGGAEASVAFWVRNLFDEDKPTTMLSLVTVISAQYERARTYGVDLTVEF